MTEFDVLDFVGGTRNHWFGHNYVPKYFPASWARYPLIERSRFCGSPGVRVGLVPLRCLRAAQLPTLTTSFHFHDATAGAAFDDGDMAGLDCRRGHMLAFHH